MQVNRARWIGLVIAIALLALASRAVVAQDGGYEIDWWTVDGGGGTSQGGDYALSGTAGQADAGTMSGGEYVLMGGFWGGPMAAPALLYDAYIPVVIKDVSS